MLRVLIADDEPLARRAMRRLVAGRDDVEIVGEAESVAQTLELIAATRPHLVFLDIRLNGGDGFDLLAAVDEPPKVIFVTAHAEYAVEAFAVDAVDYLLKPVAPERFHAALDRVQRQLSGERRETGELIELRSANRVVFSAVADIVAVRAEGDFSHVLLSARPAVMMLRSLGQFETLLPSPPFFRLGRSLIVNRDRVRSVDARSRDAVRVTLLGLVEPLIIGRAAAARLREAMDGATGAGPEG
ncbi:LytR/AlgR family response regulator transcription factor [Xanthobacter variabilis]|uniref:LytR/AlgR family response regulator transcription factor n=1 Tax=Xanthobacter variabilis TaxID=3119932 RepID=UPI00374FA319